MSRNTVAWAAKHRYPYIMLATELELTRQSFHVLRRVRGGAGYEAGSQHLGYLFKVHVDETEELAEQAGRRYVEGPCNPFLEGNQGTVKNFIQNLPGMTSRTQLLPTVSTFAAVARGGIASTRTARSSPPTTTARTSSRSRRCPSSAARRRP